MMNNRFLILLVIASALSFTACQSGVEPIKYGEDHCDYCKMSIADPKYGAEAITSKGRVYKFDAIECMIPYINENENVDFNKLLVIAFDKPQELLAVNQLTFARSTKYRSPMGANLAAFENTSNIDAEAEKMSWEVLKEMMMTN